jgi:plasmid maintenance system antidote protein VapI
MKPQHPWLFIARLTELSNITQKELSKMTWKSETDICLILNWKKPINPDYAIRFSIIFNINAKILLDMQSEIDLEKQYKKNILIYDNIRLSI